MTHDSSNDLGFGIYQHRMVSKRDGYILFGETDAKSRDYLNAVYKLSGTIDGMSTNGINCSLAWFS